MRIFRLCGIGSLTIAAAFFAVAQRRAGQAGVFDYYRLTLSWSPEFCYTNPTNPECAPGQHHGFIVHGLWPELRNGGEPEYCSRAPGLTEPVRMLDLMPDLHLIEHEWQAHGTCSGVSATEYFGRIRKTFESFRIPRQFAAPRAQFAITPFDIKKEFEEANTGLNDAEIAVECRGAYLTAVEICLSKSLSPIPCPAVRDCTARMLRIAPVR